MAKEIKSPAEVKVKIKAIELIDFTLKHPSKEKLIPSQYHFNLNITHKINNEQKSVFVITNIDIFHEDRKTQLGNIRSSCIFEIPNFNEFIPEKDNKPDFPEDMIHMLNSISLSTTRGVMFSKFRGTFLHNAILPIINPKILKPESK